MAVKECEALDKYLKKKGITRKILSDKLGKSEQALSFKFNGKTEWTRSELKHLISIGDMTDSDFMNVVMRNEEA